MSLGYLAEPTTFTDLVCDEGVRCLWCRSFGDVQVQWCCSPVQFLAQFARWRLAPKENTFAPGRFLFSFGTSLKFLACLLDLVRRPSSGTPLAGQGGDPFPARGVTASQGRHQLIQR